MNFRKNIAVAGVLGIVCCLNAGCDKAPEASKVAEDAKKATGKAIEKVEEVAEKGIDAAKKGAAAAGKVAQETIEHAKERFAKLSNVHFEEIEKKIKDLSGDALTEAQALYASAKEKFAEIKDAAPEKWEEIKKEVEDKIAELKTKLGL